MKYGNLWGMIGDYDSGNCQRYLGKNVLPPAKDIGLVKAMAYRGFLKGDGGITITIKYA